MKFGSEAWVLRKREEQCLEAAQMKLLGHLLVITKLDKHDDDDDDDDDDDNTPRQNIIQ